MNENEAASTRADTPDEWKTVAESAALLGISERQARRYAGRMAGHDRREAGHEAGHVATLVRVSAMRDLREKTALRAARPDMAPDMRPDTLPPEAGHEAGHISATPDMRPDARSEVSGARVLAETEAAFLRDALANEREQTAFLRGLIEQRDRDAAELRAALREALRAMPKQIESREYSREATGAETAPEARQSGATGKRGGRAEKRGSERATSRGAAIVESVTGDTMKELSEQQIQESVEELLRAHGGKAFNHNHRPIYLVPEIEKTTFFSMNEEGQREYMETMLRAQGRELIRAQRKAREESLDEWQSKYGHLSHEEILDLQAKEFRAKLEKPLDHFTVGYTLTVTSDESADQIHAFAEAINKDVSEDEICPDKIEIEIKYKSGLKQAVIKTDNTEETVFDIQGMTFGGRCLLYPISEGESIGFAIKRGDRFWRMGAVGSDTKRLHTLITDRNRRFGWETPPELLPDAAQTPREMAHPLHDAPIMQVANDPATVFFARVVTQPKIWQTNENECHKYAQDGQALAIYRPEDEIPDYWPDFRERVLQTLENRFTAMKGDLVADVADILFWHWLSNERPSYAGITLSQILEYRGVKPRPNTIEEHWQAMRDVRAIKLRGGGIECEALFHISAAQPNLFGHAEPPKLQTVYRYHPGYFLSEAIQRDAFFLAYYARNVWQLNYYTDANAKKLARVLRADWRRNAESYLPGGQSRYRTWRSLLDAAGIDCTSGTAISHPARFIKSIEGELEKLYEKEFIRDCAPACYHPDDRVELPRYNPLQAWLSIRTHIAPAADITDALTLTATRRFARREQLKALAEGKKRKPKCRKKAE